MTGAATFRQALLDANRPIPAGLVDPAGRPAGRRFDVYRNNVAVSLTQALERGFPVLQKLLGAEFFAAMAGVFLRMHPPESPVLHNYGEAMPGFLRGFAPVKHLPYLADIARLELALRRSYHAADTPAFEPARLAELSVAALNAAHFTFAPATAVIRSPHAIYGIWRYNNSPDAPQPVPQPENVLVTRPEFDPIVTPLSAPQAVFALALIEGQPLAQAWLRAETVSGEFDLAQTLGLLFQSAALTDLTT